MIIFNKKITKAFVNNKGRQPVIPQFTRGLNSANTPRVRMANAVRNPSQRQVG